VGRWAKVDRGAGVLNKVYVGLAEIIHKDGASMVFLAGKSPNARSYMVLIYGSGQP